MYNVLKLLGIAVVALLLAACSKGHNNNTPPASLRFINAAPNDTLSLVLNGSVVFGNQPPQSASTYGSITAGTYAISVTDVSGTVAAPAVNFAFAGSQAYSVIAYVRNGQVITTLVNDSQIAPPAGYGKIGVVNMSPDSGALDTYLVPPGTTDISNLSPQFQSTVFHGSPVWTTLVASTFDVIVTAAGNPSDVRLRLPGVTLAIGQILTVGFTTTTGGALVNAVLATFNGGIVFVPNTSARARAVSALPVAGATPVTLTVNGTAFTPVFAPSAGLYGLVTGNTSVYSISVGGTPVATLPPATFTAGGDFTILVYGQVSAPAVAVFTDNNQIPLIGVKQRLINGGVNVPAGLTLYVNNIQVATGIGYGAASPYLAIPTSADATLNLIEPSVGSISIPNVQLSPAGAVFTVFVIDSTLTPNAVSVVRDR